MNRFAELLDTRAWDRFDEVLAPDATGYGTTVAGAGEVVRLCRSFLGGCGPSQHLLGNHQIEVIGTRATATTQARVMHRGRGELAERTWELTGTYHDTLTRTDAGWRVLSRRLDVHDNFGDPAVLGPDPAG